MYIKKVSLDQRPIFLMVFGSIPCKCIAMAPPARKLWLPTKSLCRPYFDKPNSSTADLTARFISVAVMTRPVQDCDWKYVLMIVVGLLVWARM